MKLNSITRYLLRHSLVRFAIVGTAGYIVDASVLTFDTSVLRMDFKSGRAISIFIAMTFTWLGNRYLTFRERRARGAFGAAQEWLKFLGANIVGAGVNYGISVLLVRFASQPFDNKYIAQACGVLVGLVFNFTLSRKLVFKN